MTQRIYYSQQAEAQAQRQQFFLTVLVAGLGISLGTIFGLLFAPQSGEKTRQQIEEQVEQASRDLGEHAEKLRSNVEKRLQPITN